MDDLKNLKIIENDSKVNSNGLRDSIEVVLSLQLHGEEQFRVYLQNLQECQIEMEDNKVEKELFNQISNLLSLQDYTPETFTLLEFANKYHEYMIDIYNKLKNNNYESEIIISENLMYSYGLFQKYANDAFNEFVSEIRKIDVDASQVRKSLLPYSEFERWLFYHAYSLCYYEGMETPDFCGVNDKIRSKPFGDSTIYPQSQIYKVVSEIGIRHSKGWRDYFCELAIRKYKRENLNTYKQFPRNN